MSPIGRRVAYVSPMCLADFEPWCTSPNVRGLIDAGRRYIADVPMPWRNMPITHVRRRPFAEQLVHGGADLAMPKFVHRESIGRLARGTVARYRI